MPQKKAKSHKRPSRGGGYYLDLANSIAPGFPVINYRNDYFAPLTLGGKKLSRRTYKKKRASKHSKRIRRVSR